jgi:hypothetical protein
MYRPPGLHSASVADGELYMLELTARPYSRCIPGQERARQIQGTLCNEKPT